MDKWSKDFERHSGLPSRNRIASFGEALVLLRKSINDPSAIFRDGQWEAIDTVANQRKRVLVVERTGWGKSSVYFIATRILRDSGLGPTLIVSPTVGLNAKSVSSR